MNKKEWLEVGRQSLYFVMAAAGMALLMALVNLLQGKPQFAGESHIIILGFWLLMFSMFLGLSPFAMDSKQGGLEYLLTLPISRRRLLFIKLLPRLATVVLFYGVFFLLYRFIGSDAFGGYFEFFSSVYFALFFISFSLSNIHENFVVQSIWAGLALCGYLTLWSFIMTLGFAWNNNFSLGSFWRFGHFSNIIYDSSSLIAALAVFLLMLAPFVVSYFLAFKKFDLRPARTFNRRQLLFFVPLLLLALAASLGVSYQVQKGSIFEDSSFYLTENRQLLKASWPGKLTVYDEHKRHRIDTGRSFLWSWTVFETKGRLFLLGHDVEDSSLAVIRLNMGDFKWETVYNVPEGYRASSAGFVFRQYGQNLVFLQRSRDEAKRPGNLRTLALNSDRLDLVVLDMDNGRSKTLSFKNPLFKNYYQTNLFASDEINGRSFWLVGGQGQHIVRLWEDGMVEDLGLSKKMPTYFGRLLFSQTGKSLIIRRLLDSGSETIKEITGEFHALGGFNNSLDTGKVSEIYAKSGKKIIRLDLKTFVITTVVPDNGYLLFVSPGDFYYVESKFLPYVKSDKWRKVYLLKSGKMIFLKQFYPKGPGLGYVEVEEHGIVFHDQGTPRFFAFPDLKELKFKNLN